MIVNSDPRSSLSEPQRNAAPAALGGSRDHDDAAFEGRHVSIMWRERSSSLDGWLAAHLNLLGIKFRQRRFRQLACPVRPAPPDCGGRTEERSHRADHAWAH